MADTNDIFDTFTGEKDSQSIPPISSFSRTTGDDVVVDTFSSNSNNFYGSQDNREEDQSPVDKALSDAHNPFVSSSQTPTISTVSVNILQNAQHVLSSLNSFTTTATSNDLASASEGIITTPQSQGGAVHWPNVAGNNPVSVNSQMGPVQSQLHAALTMPMLAPTNMVIHPNFTENYQQVLQGMSSGGNQAVPVALHQGLQSAGYIQQIQMQNNVTKTSLPVGQTGGIMPNNGMPGAVTPTNVHIPDGIPGHYHPDNQLSHGAISGSHSDQPINLAEQHIGMDEMDVVDEMDVSSTQGGGSRRGKKPKTKRHVPNDEKDDRYYERRKRNNQAAKRSRDQRRLREENISLRASILERENAILKAQLATVREEANSLRQLLSQRPPPMPVIANNPNQQLS